MASDDGKISNTGGSSAAPKRKPYVKPAFRHEKVFETMALACGKVNATQSSCRTNRKNS
jgi:hypothetical protein